MNFSGMGFEVGQEKTGLAHSPEMARKYFHYLKDSGLHLIDQGDCVEPNGNNKVKVFHEDDLKKIEWDKYHLAYLKTLNLLQEKVPLLNWGGDHSLALATVGAFTTQFPDGYIIWIDAHADLNLPQSSATGNFHGMPLSILLNIDNISNKHFKWLGQPLDSKKLIYIGLRDLDPFEKDFITSSNIKTFFYEDVEKRGMKVIAQEILALTQNHPMHISFDIDSVDPKFAPSTGVPVKHGLTPNDLDILSVELFQKSFVRSIDIAELNPELGTDMQVDRTFLIAIHFLRSLFTKNHQGGLRDGIGERNQREYFTQV